MLFKSLCIFKFSDRFIYNSVYILLMKKEVQKQDKKKEQNRTKQIITESLIKIDNLLNKFNENKPGINSKKFFNIVKNTLGDLFNIYYEFTYEELIYKINNIDKKLNSISSAIKELKIKVDNTFIDEKDNPNLKGKIDELEEKLRKEYALQKSYIKLNSMLYYENLNELIKELSQEISEIEYGSQEISNEKIMKLADKFKLILDKIVSFEETQDKKKKKHFFLRFLGFGHEKKEDKKNKIEEPELAAKSKKDEIQEKLPETKKELTEKPHEINKDALETKKKDEIQIKKLSVDKNITKILQLIEQIKHILEKGKMNAAKQKYLQALSLYKKLKVEEKEGIYRHLLQLYHSISNFKLKL